MSVEINVIRISVNRQNIPEQCVARIPGYWAWAAILRARGGGVTRGYSFQMILNGFSLFSPQTGASLLQIYAATELKMAQFSPYIMGIKCTVSWHGGDDWLSLDVSDAAQLGPDLSLSLVSSQESCANKVCSFAAFNNCDAAAVCKSWITFEPGWIVCLHSIHWRKLVIFSLYTFIKDILSPGSVWATVIISCYFTFPVPRK